MRKAAIFAAVSLAVLAASGARALSPFTVFFDTGSFALSPQATAILDNAALAWSVWEVGPMLEIEGHSDRTGPADANQRLSCARARVVRDYLVRRGVPRDRTVISGAGEDRPMVETPDDLSEAQNRYVTVVFVEPATHRSTWPDSHRC
jgi:outer membrane protein OmpA-like peptidoglycan-associated protein